MTLPPPRALAQDPEMPPMLRSADNWPSCIADDLGHGEAARPVTLLADVRTVFDALGCSGRGANGTSETTIGRPRKLTQGELCRLLRPFGIRPKTIWPTRRRLGDMSCRGYSRSQFETAWRAYCPSADTPTQPSKIISLPRR